MVSHHTASVSAYQWLVLALHGLYCAHLVRNYQAVLPFYQKEVSIAYGALCLAYGWLVANAVLLKALDGAGVNYQGHLLVLCIGFVLMWPSAAYLR